MLSNYQHQIGLILPSDASSDPSPTGKVICATRNAVLIAGMIAFSGTGTAAFAQSSANLPDAQVEANVLKALATAPELANEQIRTTTVYGTVTISGSVETEAMRTRAENLAANANGVKKVVDELTIGAPSSAPAAAGSAPMPSSDADAGADPHAGMVLQSDGTWVSAAQADQAQNAPQTSGQNDSQMQPAPNPHAQQPNPAPQGQQPYPQAGPNGYPQQYPNNAPYGRQPLPPQYPYGAPPAGYAPYGGQQAGVSVSVPAGTLIRVRVNERIASNKSQPGSPFDGIVVNDVVAGGEVAIPRGATVHGTVIDAKSSGALAGRGELSIQLTQLSLGGKTYPITSEVWAHNGADKTVETVNKTAGFGAIGALLGAAAGGGAGAAIGGGLGAAAGLGSSASSGRGQVVIPSEGIVAFKLAQPATVTTVSEQEMQRLAYGVPYGAQPAYPPPPRYYRPYYAPYPY